MFLTTEELKELTQRSRYGAQAVVLNALGITYKVRPDGTLAVLRAHVEQQFGVVGNQSTKEKEYEPNWAAIKEDSAPRQTRKN
jgi:hypothetical protein